MISLTGDTNSERWRWVAFPQALADRTAQGKKIQQKDFSEKGKVPIVDQGQQLVSGFSDDVSMAWSGKLPVIVFGDHTRTVKYVDFPFILGADGTKILVPREDLVPKFVYYYLRTLNIPSDGYSRHFRHLKKTTYPVPPREVQEHIVRILDKQMTEVDLARTAAEARLEAAKALPAAYIRQSYDTTGSLRVRLGSCTQEISEGIGSGWSRFRLVGATRAGIAPAKESVGKNPGRYKPVIPGTVFYNPMRILLGSIAMIDEGEEAAITSPDYVVFRGRKGFLDARWFYYWLRSEYGKSFIRSLARGAVRERILYRRLAEAEVELPSWEEQLEASAKMRQSRACDELIQKELNSIDALPATLLRRAFSGGM